MLVLFTVNAVVANSKESSGREAKDLVAVHIPDTWTATSETSRFQQKAVMVNIIFFISDYSHSPKLQLGMVVLIIAFTS